MCNHLDYYGLGCCIWYSEEGTGRSSGTGPFLAVENVTANLSTASVPITVLLDV